MSMRINLNIPLYRPVMACLAACLILSLNLSAQSQNGADVNVRLTAPESGAEVHLGADVTINAEARLRNVDKSIAQVELLINNQSIGAETTPGADGYSWTWTAPAVGDYTLVAQATDSDGDTAQSEPVTLTVGDGWSYEDVTNAGGSVTYSSQINAAEGAEMAFDNSLETKWLTATGNATAWIAFAFDGDAQAINAYSIASANDAPGRDPRDWTLEGSSDGDNWETVDQRSDERWTARFQQRYFFLEETIGPYQAYRLRITRNNGDGGLTGFSEMELIRAASQPLTVALVSPESGRQGEMGQAIALAATVAGGDAESVTFFQGVAPIATASSANDDGQFTAEWTPETYGFSRFTAVARNAAGDAFSAASAATVMIPDPDEAGEWISIFDGETLDGWRGSENPDSWEVVDGRIKGSGPRSHLFYVGDLEPFHNFEWRADVYTEPGCNSGMYVHTRYQETGWPSAGIEIQINNSFDADHRRTASVYGIQDLTESPAEDNVWFNQHIIVQDNHVIVLVDGEIVNEWTEPADASRKRLDGGTVAFQQHDPGGVFYVRNVEVKLLP